MHKLPECLSIPHDNKIINFELAAGVVLSDWLGQWMEIPSEYIIETPYGKIIEGSLIIQSLALLFQLKVFTSRDDMLNQIKCDGAILPSIEIVNRAYDLSKQSAPPPIQQP